MNRTDQAHSWSLYAVLILVILSACYGFLFTDKLSEGSFVGVLMAVVTAFFGKQKPEAGSANGTGNGHAAPPPEPRIVTGTGA